MTRARQILQMNKSLCIKYPVFWRKFSNQITDAWSREMSREDASSPTVGDVTGNPAVNVGGISR